MKSNADPCGKTRRNAVVMCGTVPSQWYKKKSYKGCCLLKCLLNVKQYTNEVKWTPATCIFALQCWKAADSTDPLANNHLFLSGVDGVTTSDSKTIKMSFTGEFLKEISVDYRR